MQELQIFSFENSNVRTIQIDGEPYFVGKDIASNLGYKRTADAINSNVPDHCKGVCKVPTPGGRQNMIVINESGVLRLAANSNLPNANKFRDWIFDDVLPAIRKNGIYMTDQKAFDITTNPNSLADLLVQAGEQLKEKDLQIAEMRPKQIFADSVASSKTSILIGDLAKILKQNGIDMGARRLFAWMRNHGYLIRRKGSSYNSPTQKSMEMKIFEIKESSHVNADGVTVITKTPKVTGKGQQYFINKFLNVEEV